MSTCGVTTRRSVSVGRVRRRRIQIGGPTTALALLATLLTIGGCGGGDVTFSAARYDAIEAGDSADSVRSELGEPTSTEDIGQGTELWLYCDGSNPYYLAVSGEKVSIAAVRPPDELRLSEAPCP